VDGIFGISRPPSSWRLVNRFLDSVNANKHNIYRPPKSDEELELLAARHMDCIKTSTNSCYNGPFHLLWMTCILHPTRLKPSMNDCHHNHHPKDNFNGPPSPKSVCSQYESRQPSIHCCVSIWLSGLRMSYTYILVYLQKCRKTQPDDIEVQRRQRKRMAKSFVTMARLSLEYALSLQ
jgi:hypothetical protein